MRGYSMSVRSKLTLLLILVSIVPMILLSFLSLFQIKTNLEKKVIKEHHLMIEKNVLGAVVGLDNHKKIPLVLRDLPPVQGIIRARKNNGIDPLDNSTIQQWKKRFTSIFSSFITNEPAIDQIRVIDEKGNEVIRIGRTAGGIKVIDEDKLQNKSQRDYFQESIHLPKDEIYVSTLSLNKELGEIEIPNKPTIRFITPVMNQEGETRGIIIVNVIVKGLLDSLRRAVEGDIIMTDQEGYFLIHPDQKKEFSLDLRTGFNYFQEQPELVENTKQFDVQSHHDVKEKEYRIWKKIYYRKRNLRNIEKDESYWILYSRVKERVVFGHVLALWKLISLFVVGIFIIVVGISFFIAKKFVRPIESLKEGVKLLKTGKIKEVETDSLDEIGDLSRAFNQMAKQLTASQKELENKAIIMSDQVEELEKKNVIMAKTETRMSDMMKELKEQQQELKDQKFALDQHSIVAITDIDGKITYANDIFCKISKYSREELIGQDHRLVNSGYHSKEFFRELWGTIADGKVWKGEVRNKAKDGTFYWMDTTIVPFMRGNKPYQYIVIRTDITKRKNVEQNLARRKMELEKINLELDSFAYTVSHDLRAPLRGISSFASFLENDYKDNLGEEGTRYVTKIRNAAGRLSDLIDDLLTLSHLSRIKNPLQEVKINSLIDSVRNRVEYDLEEYKIELKIAGNMPVIVCDRIKLEEVFLNLINNAIKYNDKPEVKIAILMEEQKNYYVGVLRKLDTKILRFYIHSYQSALWNKVVKALKKSPEVVPILGYLTELEGEVKEQYEKLLEEDGVKQQDFLMKSLPELASEGADRKVEVEAKDFTSKWEEDELNKKRKKVILTFTLPPGAYATMVVKQLFEEDL